jgi:hypothetical protein
MVNEVSTTQRCSAGGTVGQRVRGTVETLPRARDENRWANEDMDTS